MTVTYLLTLATAVFGLIVSCTLLFSPKHNRFVNRFLGIGFLIFAYRSFSIYAIKEEWISDTFIAGSVTFAYYAVAPVFYLYVRTLVNDEQSLKKKDLVHFIIPGLAVLLAIFYIINGFIQKGQLALPVQNLSWQMPEGDLWQIKPLYHAFLTTFISIYYIGICWKLVYGKFLKQLPVHPQAIKIRNWICLLLIPVTALLLLLFLGQILFLILGHESRDFTWVHFVRSLVITFVFARIMLKRELLFGLPDIKTDLPVAAVPVMPEPIKETTIQPEINTIPEPRHKETDRVYYDPFGWIHLSGQSPENAAAVPIEKDRAVSYITRINDYIKTEPYTKPGFSIPSISRALSIPIHHLEFLFRYYNKYSFTEFRNVLRVQYVLTCLEQQLWKEYTVEAIGEKAGFSSRATFFRVFKNATGKSPGAFITTT